MTRRCTSMIYRSLELAMLRDLNRARASFDLTAFGNLPFGNTAINLKLFYGTKFVVSIAGEAYDSRNQAPNRRFEFKDWRDATLRKEETKMKRHTWLLLFLLASPLWAKPKVDVRVRVNEGIGKNLPQDSLSRTGASIDGALVGNQVFYLNVTVLSDNAEAVAKNNGQWCIKGDDLLGSIEYHGTLDGNNLDIEIPQKNGKTKKKSYVIFDHKWRKLSDL